MWYIISHFDKVYYDVMKWGHTKVQNFGSFTATWQNFEDSGISINKVIYYLDTFRWGKKKNPLWILCVQIFLNADWSICFVNPDVSFATHSDWQLTASSTLFLILFKWYFAKISLPNTDTFIPLSQWVLNLQFSKSHLRKAFTNNQIWIQMQSHFLKVNYYYVFNFF